MTINLLKRSGTPGRPGPTRKLRLFSRKAARPVCPDLILKRTVNTLFALILGLIFAACDSALSTDRSRTPYPIVDSGVWATKSYPGDIYWLDNNRVLFLGSENFKFVPKEEETLSIWDIRNNAVAVYKKHVASVCYQGGGVLYAQADNAAENAKGNWKYYRGKFGEERVYHIPENASLDKMNCRYTTNLPGGETSRASKFLLEQDGYIDVGPMLEKEGMENSPLIFYKKQLKDGIKMPFSKKEILSIRYYAFRNAYFLYGWYFGKGTEVIGSARPKDLLHPVWWLASDGTVTKQLIPPGVWDSGGAIFFYPVKKGIFLAHIGGRITTRDPGQSGGYLLLETKNEKVIEGLINLSGVGVSPDGCKVAFSHAPYEDADRANDKNRRTLKMIDFCIEGNQR